MTVGRSSQSAWRSLIAIWLGMPGYFLFMAGVLVAGWQVYVWVKFGWWPSKPLFGMVYDVVPSQVSSLTRSLSWIDMGVVWMLQTIPLSAFLVTTGVALIAAAHKLGGAPPASSPIPDERRETVVNGRNGHHADP